MEIDIKIDGLTHVQKRMVKLEKAIQRPDHSFSVRLMAQVWLQSYVAEGSAVGGWPELSEYTQKVRQERGYGPDHPILKQTGSLEQTTIRTLLNARSAQNVNGQGISLKSNYNGLTASLIASGAKAANQKGGKSHIDGVRSRPIPARPFWFVNPTVTGAAATGLQRWVTKMLVDYR